MLAVMLSNAYRLSDEVGRILRVRLSCVVSSFNRREHW